MLASIAPPVTVAVTARGPLGRRAPPGPRPSQDVWQLVPSSAAAGVGTIAPSCRTSIEQRAPAGAPLTSNAIGHPSKPASSGSTARGDAGESRTTGRTPRAAPGGATYDAQPGPPPPSQPASASASDESSKRTCTRIASSFRAR